LDKKNMASNFYNPGEQPNWNRHPFRRAVLRGLGVILPPLLTIVILIWVWNAVEQYVLVPVETLARQSIVWIHSGDIREEDPGSPYHTKIEHNGFVRYIPTHVVKDVQKNLGAEPMPKTAEAVYHRYVEIKYLGPQYVIPVFLSVFILVLYLAGKFLAIRFGRMFWNFIEQIIHRVPIIRNVYSSVKQVTDFIFSEHELEYTRVVAVEYPRKGIWSIGFVTGESMLDIGSAANEPVLAVLMPTSPMPVTGFTVTVRKSETIDLDITMDQAIQFIVSCGVVVPPQQLRNQLHPELPRNDSGSNELESNPQNQQVMATSPTEGEITS